MTHTIRAAGIEVVGDLWHMEDRCPTWEEAWPYKIPRVAMRAFKKLKANLLPVLVSGIGRKT